MKVLIMLGYPDYMTDETGYDFWAGHREVEDLSQKELERAVSDCRAELFEEYGDGEGLKCGPLNDPTDMGLVAVVSEDLVVVASSISGI